MSRTQWLWMQASLAVIARAVADIKRDVYAAAAEAELVRAAATPGE